MAEDSEEIEAVNIFTSHAMNIYKTTMAVKSESDVPGKYSVNWVFIRLTDHYFITSNLSSYYSRINSSSPGTVFMIAPIYLAFFSICLEGLLYGNFSLYPCRIC